MIRLIAFDLDGTIANTLPMCILAFQRGVSPYAGHELTIGEITGLFGLNEVGMIGRLAPGYLEEALEGYYAVYESEHGFCPSAFAGVSELVLALREKGKIVSMITGKDDRSCHISLRQFGMDDLFDDVLTGSERGNNKKERMLELLEKYGLAPEEFLYVGDAVADVIAAKGAGVRCLSAAWAETADRDALEAVNPGQVFDRFEDAAVYLLALE